MATQFSGDRLADARQRAGLTREAVAVATDLSYNSIQSYERGRAAPSPAALCRLVDALGVEIGDLFDEAAA